tara:strand:+ start:1867 stop:2772 length:906 start_codon:yes stop_codon:yes gene_type:complete
VNYYNEIEPYPAEWLRNLIRDGWLPLGDVDERDIRDVEAKDLEGYIQCHFFCGIGGWPHALELAGWPPDEPVWTGSCPCQPFSAAGKRLGEEDERHLWPSWLPLIAECKPSVVFGEQVASKDGRLWLAGVRDDLEKLGYAVGAADLCAAGVGAPHIRQRLWWVADAECHTGDKGRTTEKSGKGFGASEARPHAESGRRGEFGWLGDTDSFRPQGGGIRPDEFLVEERREDEERQGELPGVFNAWGKPIFIPCLDEKARRIEPGICPLAHGVPRRVGKIRAWGNAIVPQVAAEFIGAYLEIN